jgi:hypothetical protein
MTGIKTRAKCFDPLSARLEVAGRPGTVHAALLCHFDPKQRSKLSGGRTRVVRV